MASLNFKLKKVVSIILGEDGLTIQYLNENNQTEVFKNAEFFRYPFSIIGDGSEITFRIED